MARLFRPMGITPLFVLATVVAVAATLTVAGSSSASVAATRAAGPGSNSGTISLSPTSGPPGTIITVSGNAGPGCVLDKNWFGFQFRPAGGSRSKAGTQMTTSVAPNGSWQGSFAIPVFLGAPAKSQAMTVRRGSYQFYAPNCRGSGAATAGFQVTANARATTSTYVSMAVTSVANGYWLLRGDGRVTAFGEAHNYGSLPASAARRCNAVALARTYDNGGYWVACANGRVYGIGDARDYGYLRRTGADGPVTSMAVTPKGDGYWLLTASGRVHGFGAARSLGSPPVKLAPYDAIATRPGGGYVVTAANNGAVYQYPGGQLTSFGPGAELAANLVGTAVTPSGNGTWQAGTDGGVLTGGDADGVYLGGIPSDGTAPRATVTAIAATPDGKGYWLVGNIGSVFGFGDAPVYNNPN